MSRSAPFEYSIKFSLKRVSPDSATDLPSKSIRYPRAGRTGPWGPANFDLLDGFPEDKELVMGLLDARNTRLEPVEEILQEARRVSAHVSLDRIQISPSCGLDFLPRKNARMKLERLVEGARAIEEELG